MADQFAEGPRPLPLTVAADLRHRDLQIVVEDRQRHAAEERKRRDMAVEECLGRLARIRPHEASVRLWQVQAEEMDLLADTADHPDGLAEINLPMPRRVRQRHKNLP